MASDSTLCNQSILSRSHTYPQPPQELRYTWGNVARGRSAMLLARVRLAPRSCFGRVTTVLRAPRWHALFTARRHSSSALDPHDGDRGTSVMPPEVPSMTEEELRNSFEGGASRYNFGEFGTSGAEMKPFWFEKGMPLELALKLAERADRYGGVWGDPPTLTARCRELQAMLPLRPLAHLLKRHPDALAYRPATLRAKLKALSDALPRLDVLRMVANSQSVLAASIEPMRERTEVFLPLLGRSDMADLLAANPRLLQVPAAEMKARGAALQKAFSLATRSACGVSNLRCQQPMPVEESLPATWSPVEIHSMPATIPTAAVLTASRERITGLLLFPAYRIERLVHVDTCFPGLRKEAQRDGLVGKDRLGDFKILQRTPCPRRDRPQLRDTSERARVRRGGALSATRKIHAASRGVCASFPHLQPRACASHRTGSVGRRLRARLQTSLGALPPGLAQRGCPG